MVGINGRVSEELNSRSTKQVSDAKNFASPRRSAHADVEDLFTPRKASESQCPSVYSFPKSLGTPGVLELDKDLKKLTNVDLLSYAGLISSFDRRA